MNSKHNALRHVIYVVVFLLISAGIYVFSTYLFRQTAGNTRRIITTYYNEEPNRVDVVAVGGSGIYRFLDTMLCYRDEGFVAFDYCTASLPAGTILPCIRDVFKTQSPKVLILDAKRYAPIRTKVSTPLVRNILDSFPLSANRMDAISRYARLYQLSWSEELAMHLDLLLYHNNTHALLERNHWQMADNRWNQLDGNAYFNGYGPAGGVIPIDTSEVNFHSTKKEPLSKISESLLRETLEYCKGLDCQVVMVVTPSCERQESIDAYHSMADICKEYEVPFFNSLDHLEEMGIDFATDYYNKAHTNQVGALKFTRYFVNWLKTITDLPDHRGEERYAYYDQVLQIYEEKMERNYRMMARKLLRLEHRAKMEAAGLKAGGAEAAPAVTEAPAAGEKALFEEGEASSDEIEASSGEEEASSGEEDAEDGVQSAFSKQQEEKINAKISELRALEAEILSNRFFEKQAAA